LFVVSFVAALALSATIIMAQGANQQMSIQGRLTDAAGKPLDGTYVVKFDLYDAETGGASLWNEIQSVTVAKGLFQTRLGSVAAFPPGVAFDKPYYVEITVNNEKLSPRYVLAGSPYVVRTPTIPSTFAASDIVSGVLDPSRIPMIDTNKINDNAITRSKIGNKEISASKILHDYDSNSAYEAGATACGSVIARSPNRIGMVPICSPQDVKYIVVCHVDATNIYVDCYKPDGTVASGGNVNFLFVRQ